MSDELIDTVFQELCEGIPLLGPDAPLNETSFCPFPGVHNLGQFSEAYGLDLAGADQLLPAEGSQEEADLMRILEESGLCVNGNQGSTFALTSSTVSSGAAFALGDNVHSFQAANILPHNYQRLPPYATPTIHNSSGYFTMDNEPPPLIARNKRQSEDDTSSWHTSKRMRVQDMSAMEQIYPSAQQTAGFNRFQGAYEATEGNALEYNNITTRTFGSEENFPAAGSVPVSVPLSAQGLWPTMTSSAALATREHHTQTPFMAAGYNDQDFSLPIGMQHTFQQPAPVLPWDAALESSMPYRPTGYGLDVPRPSFNTAGQSTSHDLSWPSAEMEDPFLLRSMPSMPIESGFDASIAHAAAQLLDQDGLTLQPSSDAPRSRQPRRACYMSPAQPQPCPVPIAGPTFDAGLYQTDNQLPSVGIAATSSSSSSSTAPSTAKPKRRTQPPRASALSSSTTPSTTKPQGRKQPPRAASSKSSSTASSSAKPKKSKKSPPKTSGSSSSSKTPSSAEPKKRRPPQTPYDPDGVGCHICKGGFTRPSEVTKHLKTNKHRLNEFALLYPELELRASQLEKNFVCPIDGCGEGLSRLWVVRRHLEDKHGMILRKVSEKRVDDASVESVDDTDAESMDEADVDEEESD